MGVFGGVDYGKKLMQDQYNTQMYGPLWDLYNEGLKAGTDVYFPKSKLIIPFFSSFSFLP